MTEDSAKDTLRAQEFPPLDREKKKSAILYLCAFFIPLVLMWLIYIALQVYPFGKSSVLVLDLNGQYVYFFEDLRNKLTSGGSLLYTWTRALGGENMGILAYYVASPFALLTLIFPKSMITEALLAMILAKIGCCGLTMSIYLRKTRRTSSPSVLIFSTLYALCSYSVVYAHNTMWIDTMIFLPLVILGMERLITRRSFVLYVISLALSCLTNFYIGYMVCLFSFLYFFYWYFAHNRNYENNLYEERNHFIKTLGRMALYSGIAVGIAAIIILPAYYSLQFGKTEFSNPNFGFKQIYDFLDISAKLFPGSYDTVRPEGLPFLYCGVLTLLLLPLYFISRNVSTREKLCMGALFAVLLISMNASTLELVWHGFQRPNWLNCRYSYMVCFLMIVCAFRVFEEMDAVKYRYMLGVSAALCILLLVIQKQDYEWLDDLQCVWFSLFMILILTCAMHPVAKGYLRQTGTSLVMIAVCFELFVNGLFCTMDLDEDVVISSRGSYTEYFDKVQPAVDALKAYDAQHFQSAFYRMDKTSHRKTNDPMTLGIYGISNSTSTLNASVISLLADMGYSAKSHWSKYSGGTPVSDSLLGIKYVIFTEDTDDITREQIYADPDNAMYGYYNPYALSLAYAADDALCGIDRESYENPFAYLNALVTAMLGEDETVELFCSIAHTTSTDNLTKSYASGYIKYVPSKDSVDGTLTFKVIAPQEAYGHELFYYLPSDYPWECDLYVNGLKKGSYFGSDTHRVMSLGEVGADNTAFTVALTPQKDRMYLNPSTEFFYYLDTDVYCEVMERLAQGNLNIESFADTEITGTVTVPEGMELLSTSIPYDEGWHIYVDGVEAELCRTSDALLAVRITSGTHTVRMHYMPTCFVVGCTVSVCSLVVFAGAIVLHVLLRRRAQKRTLAAFESAMHPDNAGEALAESDYTNPEKEE